ncbi:MAG TPA: hypothetical protein VGJ32_05530 [Solirubrobacteraceae bacterium]
MTGLTLGRASTLAASAAMAAALVAGASARPARPTVAAPSTAASWPTIAAPAWPRYVASDYAMLSPSGNHEMMSIVLEAARSLKEGAADRAAVLARVHERFAQVAFARPEAFDATVQEAVAHELDRFLLAAGDEPIDTLDEIIA